MPGAFESQQARLRQLRGQIFTGSRRRQTVVTAMHHQCRHPDLRQARAQVGLLENRKPCRQRLGLWLAMRIHFGTQLFEERARRFIVAHLQAQESQQRGAEILGKAAGEVGEHLDRHGVWPVWCLHKFWRRADQHQLCNFVRM